MPLYQRYDGKAPVSFNQPGEHHRHRDSSLRRQAITHGSPEEEGGTWGALRSGRRQAQQQKAFIRVSNLPIKMSGLRLTETDWFEWWWGGSPGYKDVASLGSRVEIHFGLNKKGVLRGTLLPFPLTHPRPPLPQVADITNN